MAMDFSNEVILITGGTGSFGRKFTEIVLKEYNPKVVRIFSRGELKQDNMRRLFHDDPRLRFFIGDVRDKDRLWRAMDGVNIVIHAAALKQVPACEYNPIEAIRTNIDGAINVIDTAIDRGVKKVIALSTDKAVHPVNLYGATKLVAEKLFIQANVYSGGKGTRFSVVRYGNVVGSRGSIIPVIESQKKEGVITLTDERMTRFWITQSQAVHFILERLQEMEGGEIFIPKIPSMRIIDLIEVLAPNCERKVIGIRPGEKIHETLLSVEEARHSLEFNDYFLIEPEFPFWNSNKFNGVASKLPEGFEYTSRDNKKWLTKEELTKMLKELHYEE
jgi:UDP-N-acetylglucosamine 4,6-dehydratase (inverting)